MFKLSYNVHCYRGSTLKANHHSSLGLQIKTVITNSTPPHTPLPSHTTTSQKRSSARHAQRDELLSGKITLQANVRSTSLLCVEELSICLETNLCATKQNKTDVSNAAK